MLDPAYVANLVGAERVRNACGTRADTVSGTVSGTVRDWRHRPPASPKCVSLMDTGSKRTGAPALFPTRESATYWTLCSFNSSLFIPAVVKTFTSLAKRVLQILPFPALPFFPVLEPAIQGHEAKAETQYSAHHSKRDAQVSSVGG